MEYQEIMAKMTAAQATEIDKHGGLPKEGNIYFSAENDDLAIEAADGKVIDARGNVVDPKPRPDTGNT
jgi:hypothetical protein